jgi:kynurenine 3-monooxygenase
VEHFRELRDLVGNPRFLLRKRIERKLNELYPVEYKDLYSMISFTSVSYTEALQVDREQRAIVDQLAAVPDIESKLDSREIGDLMGDLMAHRASSLMAIA